MAFPSRYTPPMGWLDLPDEIKFNILVYVLDGIELYPTTSILGCACKRPCGTRPSNPAGALPISKSFANPYEIQRIAMRYGWCWLNNLPGYDVYSTDKYKAWQPMIEDTNGCLPTFAIENLRCRMYYTSWHPSRPTTEPFPNTCPVLAPNLDNLLISLPNIRSITLDLYECCVSASGHLLPETIAAYVPPKFCIGPMGYFRWSDPTPLLAPECKNRLTEETLIGQTDGLADYAGLGDRDPPLRRCVGLLPSGSRHNYYPSVFKLIVAAMQRHIKVKLSLSMQIRSNGPESTCNCNKTLGPQTMDVFFDSDDMSLHIPLATGEAIYAQEFPEDFWEKYG